MECIFCKQDSSTSKSIEHIVPESLGNKNNVLIKGIVCDKCNNYFALKIEKKVLESEFFKNFRFRNTIETKKRRIPKGEAIIPITASRGDIIFDKNNRINVILDEESFNLFKTGKVKQFYVQNISEYPKEDGFLSRLLAKMALEFLALRVIKSKNDHDLFVDEIQLDPLRNYARYNQKQENWVYHSRKIYEEDEKFYLKNGKTVDMVFECEFLPTELGEIYFVIAIKGIEFVLNMAGSSIDGYIDWLKHNNQKSPLYAKGKHFGYDLMPEFIKNKE